MSTKKKVFLTEEEIIQYCKDNNIDPSICYCKECGKFLAYDNAVFHINSISHKLVCDDNKLSFLSTRNYNGNIYRLSRCYDCVCKKFPNFSNVHFKFAQKAAKYTQYGFDVPDEDFLPVSMSRQSVTKEKMIKKYGVTEGEQRWKKYCDKQAETNTFEYKQNKYGITKEQFDEYNKSRSVTLDNLIRRHGLTEGINIWHNYIKRQRYTCSKEYFLETYGEQEGLEKYINFCNIRNSQNRIQQKCSQISLKLFNELKKEFKNNVIFYNKDEYKVKTYNNVYFVDYYDKTLNIIIEFYGDYWHMNPSIYPKDTIQRIQHSTPILAENKWEKDKQRINDIQKTLNCKIIIVWESTYKQNRKTTLQLLIDMINNKDKLNNVIIL